MKKALILLLFLMFIWQSFACYTKYWYWVADHIEYAYEMDNVYWTKLSREYRMQSAYLLNDIRKQNIVNTSSDSYQLSVREKYKTLTLSIIKNNKTITNYDRWVLIFLESRIQYKIDTINNKNKNKMCTIEQIKKCSQWKWEEKQYCNLK